MEWILIVVWLLIINGGLGGQYILNWMGNQPDFTGGKKIDISPGIMTWWREISKLVWAVIAVSVELIRGKPVKLLWPGFISLSTIIICAFTGVIENIGFFYLPRYYSPHIFAPYINVYLAFLPFFGKLLFNAPIRRVHWIGITLGDNRIGGSTSSTFNWLQCRSQNSSRLNSDYLDNYYQLLFVFTANFKQQNCSDSFAQRRTQCTGCLERNLENDFHLPCDIYNAINRKRSSCKYANFG